MKNVKLFFLLFSLIMANVAFAAFPVEVKTEQTTLTTKNVDANNVATSIAKSEQQSSTVGAPIMSSPASGKSQVVALLLVLFVGILGIHRFYLGYTVIGIIQLLTLGGFGIWALIDLIMIVTGSLKPKDGDYTTTL